MSCNCNENQTTTLDLSKIIGRLTSETSGVISASDVSALASGDVAYHHVDESSWLASTGISDDSNASRTIKGIIDGLPFDYDIKIEIKGSYLYVTLILRKPFAYEVTLKVNIKTGEWEIESDGLATQATLEIKTPIGVLGCGKWCIIRCLGFGALKCIWCGPAWPCWVACLKSSAPAVAICIARCCK